MSQAQTLEQYQAMSADQLNARIAQVRETLGEKLLILAHHYQRDEIVAQSDLRGDSFKLSKLAAENTVCEAIVFCGVHFMAETADILANQASHVASRGGRIPVILPDPTAGCTLADMAVIDEVEAAWHELGQSIDTSEITPITYVNSAASLKAFCGRHGGAVCTSSNAEKVLSWAFSERPRVLFFPDQHLGRNTAKRMGIPIDEMMLWNPRETPLGGHTPEQAERTKVFLWKGWCDVHQKFSPEHVEAIRALQPGVRVIVHPECQMSVVDAADDSGSTAKIIEVVEASPAGSVWAVGTERRLVERLAAANPDKEVLVLADVDCLCPSMSQIELPHLAWALENLADGKPSGVIEVEQSDATDSLKSLQKMLDVS